MSAKVIGIDLGTTFCAVATLGERGQPETLPNAEGEMLTPSAVLMLDETTAVVGRPALDVALDQPDRVATLVKRRMGHESFGHPVAGRDFRPETLSAVILRKLLLDAQARLGPVTKAVVTVPAYFDDTRRKATQDAAKIAGIDVLDVLDEPTAAALAYCFQTPQSGGEEVPQTVLVYDLGGGTFDVTLVRLTRTRFHTLAIEGDVRLGGKDFDDAIVNHVADLFVQKFGTDPRGDPQALVGLQQNAERAKRTLSKLPQTTVTCSLGGHTLAVPLTRDEFERLTEFLLVRTRVTTQAVLRQAGIGWDKVDRILLVGGSTHMPMTARMLAQISGKKPDTSLAVSEVVARGAALHAAIIAARQSPGTGLLSQELEDQFADVVEINVNAHSLGVEIRKGDDLVNDVLIPKNTQLPASVSRVYKTVRDAQTRVRVKVLQGEAQQAEACIPVGECWIDQLPANLPKGSPVQVTCGVAPNGLIQVSARDQTSGASAHAEIHRTSGLGDAEVAREAAYVAGLNIS